jgi:hypothetical protein
MKKNRQKPIGIIIHLYMELSQGKLPVFPYLKQAKVSFFSCFLLQNQRTGGQNIYCPGWGWGWYQLRGRSWHVNGKMRLVETIPGMEGRGR